MSFTRDDTNTRDDTKVNSRAIAGHAWRSGFDAAIEMPMLLVSAMLLLLGIGFAQALILPRLSINIRQATSGVSTVYMLGFVVGIIRSFIQAPVAVAVHRFILLGETTGGIISLRPAHTRYFIAWLILLNTFASLPLLLRFASHALLAILITSALVILLSMATVRASLIFPAVAIDIGSQNWRDRLGSSLKQTSGHFWLIFWAGVLVVLPFVVITLIISFWHILWIRHAVVTPSPGFPIQPWPVIVFSNIIEPIYVVMAAAVLSWAYKVLTRETKGEAAPI